MKNTKKVLSVVLAVVMALSALTLVAFAHSYTGVEDNANSTSIKYEVTQVASATDKNGGTYTAVDNDIYAVTVLCKAKAGSGILYLAVPVQYDKTKFAPMMLVDSGDLYCADYDGWTTDIGITATDFFTHPARYSDTNMYKADGTVATKIQAKSYMLGNSNAGPWTFQSEYIGPDDNRYDFWSAGMTDTEKANTGIMYVSLDDTSLTAKTAYLNTDAGILVTNEYLPMTTIYFHRLDGVSEADCYGAEFGVKADCFAGTSVTSCANASAAGYVAADYSPTYIEDLNYINGAVETPVKALASLTANGGKAQQIMFNVADGVTNPQKADITSVDYRFVAQFSTSAFQLVFDPANGGKITATDIAEVGFVFARTDKVSNPEDLKGYDVATLSKDSGDVRKCWTAQISTTMAGQAAFAFSCRIKNVPVAYDATTDSYSLASGYSEYYAVPYVVLKNGTSYYGSVMTSGIAARCNAYAATFLGI